MKITAVKTPKIVPGKQTLDEILDRAIADLKNSTVVAVTSKIVAICEDRVVKMENADKDKLIEAESEYYLSPDDNRFHVSLTVTNGQLIAMAGIDESNGNGYYILWPADPQKSANRIRSYLKKRFGLTKIGVIITDSVTTPLRWGVTGTSIAYSGFSPLKDYIGTHDIFGRPIIYTQSSIVNGLAAAAVLVMGEGKEQTPVAVLEDIPFVKFLDRNPTKHELKQLRISLDEDLYSQLLSKVEWKKGKK